MALTTSLLSFLPVTIFFIFISSAFLALLLQRYYAKHSKLPPGPWQLPFIGSLHQLLSGELTHHRFHRLSKVYGPLFHIKLGQVDFAVASSPDAAREVLNTRDHALAFRPTITTVEIIGYNSCGVGFSPSGPYWRQVRKICTQELLSAKKIKSLSFIRHQEARKLVGKIGAAAGSPVNLTEMFLTVSNTLITRTAFGMECKNHERFLSAMKKTIELLPVLRVVDLFPSMSYLISFLDGSYLQMKRLNREMDAVLDEIIAEHQEKTAAGDEIEEDLVDVLLRIQREEGLQVPLTMDNVKAVILDMLVGATETASNTMGWVMSELVHQPETMEKAQSEVRGALRGKDRIEDADMNNLQYLQRVIKETLRMHPPLPLLLPRTCPEATELLGFVIPAKTRVVVNAWAIARDPAIWDEPESFRPDRFKGSSIDFRGNSYEFIPFGSGRRICPGITFAMAGMELFLANLLYHFDWEMPGGKDPMELDMEEDFDGTAKRKKDLCLIAIPHKTI